MATFGDAVMALSGYQVAETQLYLADGTRGVPEFDDDGDSVSSGSMSLDVREMWRYGCPKKSRLGQRNGIEFRCGGGR